MEIVLSLLRTLVFVVATVAATVYVSRRIGRGRPLLWAGTTLLALYWLVLFGWTAYLTGSAAPNPDLGVWVGWLGHLLPFVAALAYIWGIGQAAGLPSRPAPTQPAVPAQPETPAQPPANSQAGESAPTPVPTAQVSRYGVPTATSDQSGDDAPATTPTQGGEKPDEPGAAQPAGDQPAPKTPRLAAPFAGPHAVPVVTTPSAHSAYSDDEPPKGTTKS